ncbi:MAG: metal ABC transporter ATP-binding protein [Kiritimatiellia bacterium]
MNALLPSDHEGTHHLVVRKLHAHYGKVCALHDISFQMQCGSMIALVGGNGAGKTTLMKSIVGLVPATTGAILWHDRPVQQGIPEIAYLPQRQDVDWRFPLTVRGLVEMGRYARLGALRPMRPKDYGAVDDALSAMQLEKLAERQIGALSGGQQQRAFIARALAQEAHVLLLDEPFAGLDHPSSRMLGELLRALAGHGRLVIASHHDLSSLEALFDEVLLLNRRLVKRGKPADVLLPDLLKEAFGG